MGDPVSGQPSEPAGRDLLVLVDDQHSKDAGLEDTERFTCQATELLRAAPSRLPFLDLSQYVADVRTGNVSMLSMMRAFLIGLFNRLQQQTARFLPKQLRFTEAFVAASSKAACPDARLRTT